MSGNPLPRDAPDPAIARVLAAEADARVRIDAARSDAQAMVDVARHTLAQIDARATRRLAVLLAHMQQDHERALAALETPPGAIVQPSVQLELAAVAAARVAARLTGADP